MLLAPTSGDIGVQPHGHTARVINRSGGALVVGDVVVTSFAHSGVVYPATTTAETRLTPFSNVVKADGNASPITKGYLGAVVDLGSANGANNTEVVVQFGGIVNAKVTATTAAIAFGENLGVSDGAGAFGNAAATTSSYPAAVSLNTTNISIGATTIVPVLVVHDIWFGADI